MPHRPDASTPSSAAASDPPASPSLSPCDRHWLIELATPPTPTYVGVNRYAPSVCRYHLAQLWCIHAYRHHAELTVDDQTWRIKPGDVSVIAPAVDITFAYAGDGPHAVAHFRIDHQPTTPTDATNISAATNPATSTAPAAPAVHIPCVQQPAQPNTFDAIERLITLRRTQPDHARAALWTLLWSLTADGHTHAPAAHDPRSPQPGRPEITRALELVDHQLHQPLRLPALAQQVGLSVNHLIRLFRTQTGQTPAAYLRDRRAERARYLLVNTSLPIKAVAAEVGWPELQQFNRAMHRAFHASPRTIRNRGPNADAQ